MDTSTSALYEHKVQVWLLNNAVPLTGAEENVSEPNVTYNDFGKRFLFPNGNFGLLASAKWTRLSS